MTEAQRRYLFRILAGQGLEGTGAESRLKELLGVEILRDATKAQATKLIDRLLKGTEEEHGLPF